MVVPPPELATADVCDRMGMRAAVVNLAFNSYGGRPDFSGPAVTVRTHEDNSRVKEQVSEPGQGRVLMVDGGGSMKAALVGGNLAALAAQNGWSGIIVYGAVRDRHELGRAQVGVFALGTCPRRSEKRDLGTVGEDLALGGVVIRDGFWITADGDGVVVTAEKPVL